MPGLTSDHCRNILGNINLNIANIVLKFRF